MINTLPITNLENISRFEHAVFYCINQSSERMAVGVVSNVKIVNNSTLEFSVSHFPVLENIWNVFGAELYFYKKGVPFSMNIHGTAWFNNNNEFTVQFKVLYIESAGMPDVKEYSLQETLTEFFSNTGTFFKRMIATGF
ncbi:hypothetical protein [Parafilimonas terrae]|uniref:Uncharacterized protein n=1 Tax=Parafilimonas terrae TaxID=1465490 RepID=A0A1I5THB0_9BACT|nr:hypothetical protein [Parafilimonas terrae]SFP82241.1 hypothetical protein SAMN05444277_102125 [Parafilimonas terrae]